MPASLGMMMLASQDQRQQQNGRRPVASRPVETDASIGTRSSVSRHNDASNNAFTCSTEESPPLPSKPVDRPLHAAISTPTHSPNPSRYGNAQRKTSTLRRPASPMESYTQPPMPNKRMDDSQHRSIDALVDGPVGTLLRRVSKYTIGSNSNSQRNSNQSILNPSFNNSDDDLSGEDEFYCDPSDNDGSHDNSHFDSDDDETDDESLKDGQSSSSSSPSSKQQDLHAARLSVDTLQVSNTKVFHLALDKFEHETDSAHNDANIPRRSPKPWLDDLQNDPREQKPSSVQQTAQKTSPTAIDLDDEELINSFDDEDDENVVRSTAGGNDHNHNNNDNNKTLNTMRHSEPTEQGVSDVDDIQSKHSDHRKSQRQLRSTASTGTQSEANNDAISTCPSAHVSIQRTASNMYSVTSERSSHSLNVQIEQVKDKEIYDPILNITGTYTGEWDVLSKMPHGTGILTYSNKRVFEGNLIFGHLVQGTMQYEDGSSQYTGQWFNQVPDGAGTMYYGSTGQTFYGTFTNGRTDQGIVLEPGEEKHSRPEVIGTNTTAVTSTETATKNKSKKKKRRKKKKKSSKLDEDGQPVVRRKKKKKKKRQTSTSGSDDDGPRKRSNEKKSSTEERRRRRRHRSTEKRERKPSGRMHQSANDLNFSGRHSTRPQRKVRSSSPSYRRRHRIHGGSSRQKARSTSRDRIKPCLKTDRPTQRRPVRSRHDRDTGSHRRGRKSASPRRTRPSAKYEALPSYSRSSRRPESVPRTVSESKSQPKPASKSRTRNAVVAMANIAREMLLGSSKQRSKNSGSDISSRNPQTNTSPRLTRKATLDGKRRTKDQRSSESRHQNTTSSRSSRSKSRERILSSPRISPKSNRSLSTALKETNVSLSPRQQSRASVAPDSPLRPTSFKSLQLQRQQSNPKGPFRHTSVHYDDIVLHDSFSNEDPEQLVDPMEERRILPSEDAIFPVSATETARCTGHYSQDIDLSYQIPSSMQQQERPCDSGETGVNSTNNGLEDSTIQREYNRLQQERAEIEAQLNQSPQHVRVVSDGNGNHDDGDGDDAMNYLRRRRSWTGMDVECNPFLEDEFSLLDDATFG